jgi:hypothetical protein
MRTMSSLCFLILCPVLALANRNDKLNSFPSTPEINLLVTQADRAMDQYKLIVDQAEQLLGKDAPDAFSQDRKLIANSALIQKALKAQPQKFNSPLGFDTVINLDDASRNAVLCASSALTHAVKDLAGGTIQQTTLIITLSQNCTDVSTLLYTVSENAGALYEKYLSWQSEASAQAMNAIDKCTAALKEVAARKKQ